MFLREHRPEDFEVIYQSFFADPEVMRFVGEGMPWMTARARERFEKGITVYRETGLALLPVIEKATGQLIGECGVQPMELKGPQVEIGYRFRESAWGQGFATEMAAAVKYAALRPKEDGGLGLPRLIAVTYPENAASRRVLEKIGMTFVGETGAYYDVTSVLYQSAPP